MTQFKLLVLLWVTSFFTFVPSQSLGQASPVQDEVGIFSKSWVADRSQALSQLYQSSRVQIQVMVVNSLNGNSIEQVGIELADKLKLGDADTDKGLIVLIAPNQRQARIEVGQGLEGDIPDIIAKRIIEDQMLPLFRQQNYEGGVDLALASVIERAAPQYAESFKSMAPAPAPASMQVGRGDRPVWVDIILFVFMLFFWIFAPRMGLLMGLMGGFPGGRYPRGGGFGSLGGGWGGGGGGFSGGGASGRW